MTICALATTFLITTFFTFTFAHLIVRPLRKLNVKLAEILDIFRSGGESEIKVVEQTSEELTILYEVFKQLIQDRKFQKSRFLQQEDALAVIDLAETCQMFEKANYKAAGVCYNNIANI